jgi:hypothetical protein
MLCLRGGVSEVDVHVVEGVAREVAYRGGG